MPLFDIFIFLCFFIFLSFLVIVLVLSCLCCSAQAFSLCLYIVLVFGAYIFACASLDIPRVFWFVPVLRA